MGGRVWGMAGSVEFMVSARLPVEGGADRCGGMEWHGAPAQSTPHSGSRRLSYGRRA